MARNAESLQTAFNLDDPVLEKAVLNKQRVQNLSSLPHIV
jgi:hypothetical protein